MASFEERTKVAAVQAFRADMDLRAAEARLEEATKSAKWCKIVFDAAMVKLNKAQEDERAYIATLGQNSVPQVATPVKKT
jgi:hypothetical protein